MKSNGIVRAIDKMGRVVIPKELRNQLGVKNAEDSFEIFSEDDRIILKKYQPLCVLCNFNEGIIEYEGQPICEACIEKLKTLLEEHKINTEGDELL